MNVISYSWNFNQRNNVLHIYAQSFHHASSDRLTVYIHIRHLPFVSQIRSKRDSSNEKHRNAIMSIIIQNDEKADLIRSNDCFSVRGKLICANIPSSTFPVARQMNTYMHTAHNAANGTQQSVLHGHELINFKYIHKQRALAPCEKAKINIICVYSGAVSSAYAEDRS